MVVVVVVDKDEELGRFIVALEKGAIALERGAIAPVCTPDEVRNNFG